MIDIPQDVRDILYVLREAGHQAYLVGGCVRDMLAGVKPHDYDIATSAAPDEVRAVFENDKAMRVIGTGGIRYGTTVVVTAAHRAAEVTTFRRDGAYVDGRRPSGVAWERSIEHDLARRDFTVGAMAMGVDGAVIDPFGGRADLETRLIRAVGEPDARFREDALRMLRAVRFAAYGYTIEAETWAAVLRNACLAERLAPERVAQEVARTLASACPEKISLALEAGLLTKYLPCRALADAASLRDVPTELRMSSFLYMATRGADDAAHAADIASNRLDALPQISVPRHSAEAAARALRFDIGTIYDCRAIDRYANILCAAVNVGTDITDNHNENAYRLKQLFCELGDRRTRAVAAASGRLIEADSVIASGEPRNLSMLCIGGSDLIKRGIEGTKIGAALRRAFDIVAKNPEMNIKETLLPLILPE